MSNERNQWENTNGETLTRTKSGEWLFAAAAGQPPAEVSSRSAIAWLRAAGHPVDIRFAAAGTWNFSK